MSASDNDESALSRPAEVVSGSDRVAVQTSTSRIPSSVHPNGRTDEGTVGLLLQVPARPDHRKPERYAFQFWTDQITRLKKLRQLLNLAKDPEDRDEITLSDLARKAMDEYLDRQAESTNTTAQSSA